MKCPKCGKELTPSKKDANYLLCFDCKKKYKIPQKPVVEEAPVEKSVLDEATTVVSTPETQEAEEQKYSNIPSKEVREEREEEMRKAYDDLLAVEGKKKKKKRKDKKAEEVVDDQPVADDSYDDIYDEDEKMSKAPIVILAIAIVAVGALIACMLLL